MNGDKLEQQQLDLSFLQVGTTDHNEALAKLNVIDTGYSDPRLFWGRWYVSKWGWGFFGIGGPGGDRIWHVNNLVILFDEKGVVTDKKIIASDKELWSEVTSHLQEAPKLDLTTPISLNLGSDETLTLRADWMEFSGPTLANLAVIYPQEIIRISQDGPEGSVGPLRSYEYPTTQTCHTLYFAEKTPAGKKISLCIGASSLSTLFRYLYQSHPGAMRWE